MFGALSRLFLFVSIIFTLSGCEYTDGAKPKADSPNPFSKKTAQFTNKLNYSLVWIDKVIKASSDSGEHLDKAIEEVVPYNFDGQEYIEVGKLVRESNGDLLRYHITTRIDKKLRVYLAIHVDKNSNLNWEYFSVDASIDGHSYKKTYSNRITK